MNQNTTPETAPHPASPWVRRFAGLVPGGGSVLDLACGAGRHTRLFLWRGHPVVAVDSAVTGIADIAGQDALEVVACDLESGQEWPLRCRRFAGIVVTNYLYRPIFPDLIGTMAPGCVLIYETFAVGNERFGRPRNPDHLLKSGELLQIALANHLSVVAYEHGHVERPRPAILQRICAVKPADDTVESMRLDCD